MLLTFKLAETHLFNLTSDIVSEIRSYWRFFPISFDFTLGHDFTGRYARQSPDVRWGIRMFEEVLLPSPFLAQVGLDSLFDVEVGA